MPRAGARAEEEQSQRLQRYRAKRDFAATPEPAPGSSAAAGKKAAYKAPARKHGARKAGAGASATAAVPPATAGGRFVIHEHHARRLHWDLRLERCGVLASWALPKGLPLAPEDNRFAAATEDHPLEYLDFEGQIPKGAYGAGKITIWDHGTYECLKWEPRKVEVALHGQRVSGRYALFPIKPGEQVNDWMIHRMDPAADPARETMPRHLAPMLARAGELPADEDDWGYEVKWDGVRALAYSQPGELALESRNLIDISEKYPELAALARALGARSAVLDGEIVAFGSDGRPSFAALQQRMQLASRAQARRRMQQVPVHYMIFDLLWLDGHSLMGEPYRERRARLAELGLRGPNWQTPEYLTGEGEQLLAAVAAQGMEGLVAKRLQSKYEPGRRSSSWIKIKQPSRQEFVVGGWLPGQGRRRERVGALLLGVHEPDGSLRYAGRVGSGFSERELDRLARLLRPLQRTPSPFAAGGLRPPRGAVFCEPQLVAEVSFSEWTGDGALRHPVYLGLREDKPAALVVRERSSAERAPLVPAAANKTATVQVQGHELKLSNLEKVLYPAAGMRKRELIEYYAQIAPVLLGHLEGRPLTVKRWPDGVQGQSFFQKQAPAHRPSWVRTATLPSERKPIDYILAEDEATIVWLANLAAIELHTPLARAEAIDRPTALVFDLDPGTGAGVLECARVALTLHGTFERIGLQSFAKTSGLKGLQVYVPLNHPDVRYAHTKPFAKTVAELLEQAEGELVVSRMSKARRTGRVLVDWSQNDAKKTTVCVYSLRAAAQPTASTPLEWDELDSALRKRSAQQLVFEAEQVLERVRRRGDLFAPVLSLVQELPRL